MLPVEDPHLADFLKRELACADAGHIGEIYAKPFTGLRLFRFIRPYTDFSDVPP
jgi:hypothetical protein